MVEGADAEGMKSVKKDQRGRFKLFSLHPGKKVTDWPPFIHKMLKDAGTRVLERFEAENYSTDDEVQPLLPVVAVREDEEVVDGRLSPLSPPPPLPGALGYGITGNYMHSKPFYGGTISLNLYSICNLPSIY